MTITLTRGTGANRQFVRLAGIGQVLHDQFTVADGTMEQVAQGCRWVDVDVFDRANEQNVITFVVDQQHDSIDDAERFLMEQKIALRGLWSANFVVGNAVATRWIKNCVCRMVDARYLGRSTQITYRITGGRFRLSAADIN
jgi:hypothetical protein